MTRTETRIRRSRTAVVCHSVVSLITCVCVLWTSSDSARGELVVGSFDVARGGFDSIADAPEQAAGRAAIQAFRPDVTFTSTGVLTSSFLSGVTVLALGGQTSSTTAVTPLSAAEQSALFDFVVGGGSLAIFTDNQELDPAIGDASRASFLDPFGLQTTGLSLAPTATIIDTGHPLVDGPFGTISQLSIFRSGWYTDLGPYAHAIATEDAFGMTMLAAIERDVIAPGSGRVVFVADSNVFDDPFISGQILFGNMLPYLVPEPGCIVQFSLGMCCLAVFAARRRPRAGRPMPLTCQSSA